jgi:hypothetical protein
LQLLFCSSTNREVGPLGAFCVDGEAMSTEPEGLLIAMHIQGASRRGLSRFSAIRRHIADESLEHKTLERSQGRGTATGIQALVPCQERALHAFGRVLTRRRGESTLFASAERVRSAFVAPLLRTSRNPSGHLAQGIPGGATWKRQSGESWPGRSRLSETDNFSQGVSMRAQ